MKASVRLVLLTAAVLLPRGAAGADPLSPPDLSHYLRWGPFRVRPNVTLSNLGYDSNIFETADEAERQGSWTATVSPRLEGLVLFGHRAFLTFDERLDYTAYVSAGELNYLNHRGNARVKVYDSNLNLLRMYTNVGNPWEICVSGGPHQYLFVSNSNPDSNPAASWNQTGEVYKMELDGTIIGRFGRAGKEPGEFQTIHGLDCRNPNELYTSEISAWRAQKILVGPRPVSQD